MVQDAEPTEVLTPTEVASFLALEDELAEAPAAGEYFVSISGRGVRRLHRAGECALRPGVDCGKFLTLGDVRPNVSSYDHSCRKCFDEIVKVRSKSLAVPSSSSTSSASSTSTA